MTALILLALGVHDLASVSPGPWRSRPRWRLVVAAVVLAAALGLLALAGRSAPALLGAGLTAVGVVVGWHGLATARPVLRVAWAAGVAVLVVAELSGGLPVLDVPPGMTLLGGGLVLVATANLLSRDVLVLSGRPSTDGVADGAPASGPGGLRGGRFIGPMERLLMVVLGLAAAWQVVAAIMAAKGIVRFPEISQDTRARATGDGPPGASAEEFLVGSLASWSIAAGVGLVMHRALTGL